MEVHEKHQPNELWHDKTNKVSVRPAKTQISLSICPVWSESSLSAWRNLGSLATHWADSEDWSDWVDTQADPSFFSAHTHFFGFVMSWLRLCSFTGFNITITFSSCSHQRSMLWLLEKTAIFLYFGLLFVKLHICLGSKLLELLYISSSCILLFTVCACSLF